MGEPAIGARLITLILIAQWPCFASAEGYVHMPDLSFVVAGCQKCGTSSLYMNMIAHPRIWGPRLKETFALNGNWGEPAHKRCNQFIKHEFMVNWFPGAVDLLKSDKPKAKDFVHHLKLGDFSTSNFHCGCCMSTLSSSFPDLKVIILLRDPIRRSISRYEEQKIFQTWYFLNLEESSNSAEQHITVESTKIKECIQRGKRLNSTSNAIREECIEPSNILGWSMYEWFIPIILQLFSPDKLLWIYTEDLAYNMTTNIQAVEEFLGLEPFTTDRSNNIYNARNHLGWKNVSSPETVEVPDANEAEKEAHWERYCQTFRTEQNNVYNYWKTCR